MAEFTRDIKQLQQTAGSQPQFAPPSQSVAGDVVNMIGTGLDFYAKGQAQDKLEGIKAAQAAQNKRMATGQDGLRQLRLSLSGQGVSGTEILKRENDYLKKYSVEERWAIVGETNKVSKTTTAGVMSSADIAIKKQQDDRYTLETNVAEISPFLSKEISLDASESELQDALVQGKAAQAQLQARQAQATLDNSLLVKQGKEADNKRSDFVIAFGALSENAYAKEANKLISQANFDDPTQIAGLISQNKEYERLFIEQAVQSANAGGVSLTPKQALESFAPQLTLFSNIESLLKREDAAKLGTTRITEISNNAVLAMRSSTNKQQRDLAGLVIFADKFKGDVIGQKIMDAWGGAIFNGVGDDLFGVLQVNKDEPSAQESKLVLETKNRTDTFLKDAFKNAGKNVPDATKLAVGTTMKEKLQGSKATRERMINEGGLVTYIKAMSEGSPEMLLLPEDRDEILAGVVDYSQDFLRRAIPQLLTESVPITPSLFTKPLPPKGFEGGLPTTEAVNRLNALEPDTLRVTWNQSAPISKSVKSYNQFVGEFFTAIDKLGASEAEVKYLKNEIARGFIVANKE